MSSRAKLVCRAGIWTWTTPPAPAKPAQVTERWWPIPGYAGAYEVSDQGRVRSWLQRGGHKDRGDIRTATPTVLAMPCDKEGRPTVNLRSPDGRYKVRQVCALVLEAFVGLKPQRGWYACHWDDVKSNNNWYNLRWAPPKANFADMVRNNRWRHHRKLFDDKLDKAETMRAEGQSWRVVAAMLGTSHSTLRAALARRAKRGAPLALVG